MALDYGHVDVVRYLLETDTVDDQATYDLYEGGSLIFAAVVGGQIPILHPLFELGTDVNEQDRQGDTALAWAARQRQPFPAKELLDHADIEPDLGNKRGMTPLLMAAKFSSVETVELLLGVSNIEPHRIGIYGFTAYHSACDTSQCATGHIECQRTVQILELPSSHVCSPQATDRRGRTPLHLAARNGCSYLVSYLAYQGVALDVIDEDGLTPEMVATTSQHPHVATLLAQCSRSATFAHQYWKKFDCDKH